MSPPDYPLELTVAEARALMQAHPDRVQVLDVREPHELAICQLDGAAHVPMSQIPAQAAALPRDRHLLVLCHHGVRSLRVAMWLQQQGFRHAASMAGGIEEWSLDVDQDVPRY